MISSVSYKVSLITANQDTEVRRISVSKNVDNSLTYLRGKLLTEFPTLKETKFSVFWTDDEGDVVSITSEEDLNIALAELEGPIYKIIVKPNLEDIPEGCSLNLEKKVKTIENPPPEKDFQERGILPPRVGFNSRSLSSAMQFLAANVGGLHWLSPRAPGQGHQDLPAPTPTPTIQNPTPTSASHCPFSDSTVHSGNCFCHQPNVLKNLAFQAVNIASILPQASFTLSSAMMLLPLLLVLPQFLLTSLLYLTVAASLGLPLTTLLAGHLLYSVIACCPPALLVAVAMWAVHKIFVQRRTLGEEDVELWRRWIEGVIGLLHDLQR